MYSNLPYVTSLNPLIQAKKRWRVSVAALAYRLHKQGILSDWQYRTYCININQRFGVTEPDEMDREKSVIWEKVFCELWKEGITRSNVAKELSLPIREVNSLLFGLVGADTPNDEAK